MKTFCKTHELFHEKSDGCRYCEPAPLENWRDALPEHTSWVFGQGGQVLDKVSGNIMFKPLQDSCPIPERDVVVKRYDYSRYAYYAIVWRKADGSVVREDDPDKQRRVASS